MTGSLRSAYNFFGCCSILLHSYWASSRPVVAAEYLPKNRAGLCTSSTRSTQTLNVGSACVCSAAEQFFCVGPKTIYKATAELVFDKGLTTGVL